MKIYFFKQIASIAGWYVTDKPPIQQDSYCRCDSNSYCFAINRKTANIPELKWLHKFIDENHHWFKNTEFGELEL